MIGAAECQKGILDLVSGSAFGRKCHQFIGMFIICNKCYVILVGGKLFIYNYMVAPTPFSPPSRWLPGLDCIAASSGLDLNLASAATRTTLHFLVVQHDMFEVLFVDSHIKRLRRFASRRQNS